MKQTKIPPMTATTAISDLKFVEETGDYVHVGRCLGWFSDLIVATGTAEQKAELEALRGRFNVAEEHMRIHGEDSLLKLDHPQVKKMFLVRAQLDGHEAPTNNF